MSLEFDEAVNRHRTTRGPACGYSKFSRDHAELAKHVERHLDDGTPATVISDTLKEEYGVHLGSQSIRNHMRGRCACS